jgi:transposase InsO family protein
VDEKTGIQAKERVVPTSAASPGRPARQEFEYRRHGVAGLLTALDVHTGQVMATNIVRNDSTTFISFLTDIEAKVPVELNIHLIIDNGSSHRSKQTAAWLAEHPRFVAHYTPVHASWLNQVWVYRPSEVGLRQVA